MLSARGTFAVLAMVAPTAAGQQPSIPVPFRPIAAELEGLTSGASSPAIAVAVVHHGRIIWEAGFGFSDAARTVRATANTPVAVGSIAKSVTAVALMRLVERGDIVLDQPLYRYLPGGPRVLEGDSTRLTPLALASNTGGIPHLSRAIRSSDSTAPLSDAQLFAQFGHAVFPPGESYHYSNTSFGVLGLLLETVTRKPFSQLVHDDVFRPLGMVNSFFAEPGNARAYAVRRNGDGSVAADYLYTQPVAGAGLVSSAHDLALFGSFHAGRPVNGTMILNTASMAQLHRPVHAEAQFAMGVFANGYNVISDGAVLGGAGIIGAIPSEELAVAIVTNQATDNSPTYAFLDRLLDAALTLEGKTRREAGGPPAFYASRPFAADAATTGTWNGSLHLEGRKLPVVAQITENRITVSINGQPAVATTPPTIEAGMLRFQLPATTLGMTGNAGATLLFHGNRLTGVVVEPTTRAGLGFTRFLELSRQER